MFENVLFFKPPQNTAFIPNRCTCNELTAGLCAYCCMNMPSYEPYQPFEKKKVPPATSIVLNVTIDSKSVMDILQSALSKLLRDQANKEEGTVRDRLLDVADLFEEQTWD